MKKSTGRARKTITNTRKRPRPATTPTHGAKFAIVERAIPKSSRPHGPQSDPRFALHQRQPRADKLDARQRTLCQADHGFKEALRQRVGSEERFSAFIDGASYYIALERPCARCGDFRKRTRDRSCYRCHLLRGAENFERMRAGVAPKVMRTKDSHLDLLERQRSERGGECVTREFGSLTVKRWPTGRLEVLFPDGHREHDLAKGDPRHVYRLMDMLPELREALIWAGWY